MLPLDRGLSVLAYQVRRRGRFWRVAYWAVPFVSTFVAGRGAGLLPACVGLQPSNREMYASILRSHQL